MKWINQKIQKPIHMKTVLVTDQVHVWMGDFSWLRNNQIGGWAVVYDGAPSVISENITHWMELPDPIKGYADTNN